MSVEGNGFGSRRDSSNRNPWDDPAATISEVELGSSPDHQARLLDESMKTFKKQYEDEGKNWHMADGTSENYQYTNNYLKFLKKDLERTGKIPQLALPFLRLHKEFDISEDGFVNLRELKVARYGVRTAQEEQEAPNAPVRGGNRDRVQQAFLEHLIKNYDSYSQGNPRGIRISNEPTPPAPKEAPREQVLEPSPQAKAPRLDRVQMMQEQVLQEMQLNAIKKNVEDHYRAPVNRGDTYWSIALRLTGGNRQEAVFEVDRLRQLNGIPDRQLQPGMRLRTREDWQIDQEARQLFERNQRR